MARDYFKTYAVFSAAAYTTNNATDGEAILGWQPIAVDRFKATSPNFAGQLYTDGQGNYRIAFRGSDKGGDFLGADIALLAGTWQAQMTDAINFAGEAIRQIKADTKASSIDAVRSHLDVTGHSLGGGLSELTAKFYGLNGMSFDGPGVSDQSLSEQFKALKQEWKTNGLDDLADDYALNPAGFEARQYTAVGTAGKHLDDISIYTSPHIGDYLNSLQQTPATTYAFDLGGISIGQLGQGLDQLPEHQIASIFKEEGVPTVPTLAELRTEAAREAFRRGDPDYMNTHAPDGAPLDQPVTETFSNASLQTTWTRDPATGYYFRTEVLNMKDKAGEFIGSMTTDSEFDEHGQAITSKWKLVDGKGNLVFRGDRSPDSLITDLQSRFQTALTTVSPLILDLDHDSIETLSTAQAIHFDHDGNRYAETTGWVAPEDGLLVWDRNGNGVIDDGSELFGNYASDASGSRAANGFIALAALDDNHDGKIDAADAAFSQLRVWKDADSNAVVGNDELLSLNAAGVQSLGLDYASQSVTDAQGNQLLQAGSYVGVDGDMHAVVDAWFATDTARTVDLTNTPIDDAIAALPDLPGFGNVPSLHQAMARDASGQLKTLVSQFAQERDSVTRNGLMRQILFAWTGSNQYGADSRGTYIGDGRKLYTLEAFLGRAFIQSAGTNEGTNMPGPNSSVVLANAYQLLENHFLGQLLAQAHPQGILDQLSLVWDPASSSFRVDATRLADTIDAALREDALTGALLLDDATACLQASGDIGAQALADIDARGFKDHPMVQALSMFKQESRLFGGAGDDTIRTSPGNDLAAGGRGNDLIIGSQGDGADTILFGAGDGIDTVRSSSVYSADLCDTIDFRAIALKDVEFVQDGNALRIKVRDASDQLVIEDFFSSGTYATVSAFHFADGATLDRKAVLERAVIYGTDGDDQIHGNDYGSNRIQGLGGDDVITGSVYADIIDGGDGNDTINAGNGDDVVTGGRGNDLILGDRWDGADTIRFARGDGMDTISSTSFYAGDLFDRLQFIDIASTDVDLTRVDNNLCIRVHDSTDQVLLTDFFAGSSYSTVTRFELADGMTLDRQAVLDKAITWGTEGNDHLRGADDNSSRIFALGGDDMITGSPYADVINGGDGNDRIQGGSGDDLLIGGHGDDLIVGNPSDGADTIRYARGDGADTIDSTSGWSSDMADTLQFTDSTQAEIDFIRAGNDLRLALPDSGDSVTLTNFFGGDGYSTVANFRFADGTTLDRDAVKRLAAAVGTDGDDVIRGGSYDNNTIRGLGGNDMLYGGAYDDVIDGGPGNDIIDGGAGNDTILFSRGGGADTVVDANYYADSYIDTISFTDIASTGVDYRQQGADLVVQIRNTEDSVTVRDFFGAYATSTVHRFQFADAVTLDASSVRDLAATVVPREGDGITHGDDGKGSIAGGAGTDGYAGAPRNDTYTYSPGDGANTITDYDTTPNNTDALTLGSGITRDQLWMMRNGSDLDISLLDGRANDRITIDNWYANAAYRIEQIKLDEGATLYENQVDALVSAMAAFAPPPAGSSVLPDAYQTALAPVFAANWK